MEARSFQGPGGPTDADRKLAAAASEIRKQTVSAWQIKRWREGGYLPTRRRFLGRGQGSGPVEYPPEAAEHAARLAEALETYRTLDEANLVCFVRGATPPERSLKRSYAKVYRRLFDWLDKTAASNDSWQIADAVASLLSRRSAGIPRLGASRERLRNAGRRPGLLRDVLANIISVFLGVAEQVNVDSLVAFGADGLLAPIRTIGPLATRDDFKLDWLRFSAIADAIENATRVELELARDSFALLREVARTFASVAGRTEGLQLDALSKVEGDDLAAALIGVPGVILIRRLIGAEQFDATVERFRSDLPQMHATERLVDALPTDLHRHLSPDVAALAALPETTRDRLVAEVRRHLAANPGDAALLADTTDSKSPETPSKDH